MRTLSALFTVLPTLAFAAGPATDTFTVSATIIASCTVIANDLPFPEYDPLGGNIDATSAIDVTCSNGADWTLAIDGGNEASTAARKMDDGGGNKLSYQLYTDPARTVVWDDVNNAAGTGSGGAQSQTVYGRIDGGQNTVPVGSYSDTVTVTVNY